MNYNKAVIVGRVTQSPDLRKTPGGQSVTSFGVATNRLWTDKAGEKHEDVEFHNVVLWGKLADLASAYVQKGSLVLVEGRLETHTWTDKESNPHKTTQIVADGIQFGPRPGTKEPEEKVAEPSVEDLPLINLEEEEIKPEDIPF